MSRKEGETKKKRKESCNQRAAHLATLALSPYHCTLANPFDGAFEVAWQIYQWRCKVAIQLSMLKQAFPD